MSPFKRPIPVADLLLPLLREQGLDGRLAETWIRRDWARLVGPETAAHSRPGRLRFRRLEVAVDGSAWIHHLTLTKARLLDRFAELIGPGRVTDLRFRPRGERRPAPLVPPKVPEPPQVPAEDAAAIRQAVGAIAAPEIRESLARLLARSLTPRTESKPAARPRRNRRD